MSTIANIKMCYSKLKEICKEYNVEILEYSMEQLDSYMLFKYQKNNSFFNYLYLLREKEYVFHFEKKNNCLFLSVSGKLDLYEDILEVFEGKEKQFSDIDLLISYMDKIVLDKLDVVIYFNGVTYYYKISDNEFGNALKYYDFSYDGYWYYYQINSYEGFSEIIKKINKDIGVYNNLMKDVDAILEENKCLVNVNFQKLREIYSRKGNKELFIIFKNDFYYIILKINNNVYVYRYSNKLMINNMIPDVLELYLDNSKGLYKEERNFCLGRSFYANVMGSNNKLFICNFKDEDMEGYIQYINLLSKEIRRNIGYNENVVLENLSYKSAGYIDVIILSFGVLIFSIFVFLITLSFLR